MVAHDAIGLLALQLADWCERVLFEEPGDELLHVSSAHLHLHLHLLPLVQQLVAVLESAYDLALVFILCKQNLVHCSHSE